MPSLARRSGPRRYRGHVSHSPQGLWRLAKGAKEGATHATKVAEADGLRDVFE